MNKTIITSIVLASLATSAFAGDPPVSDGYYRIVNHKTNRYIYVYDNTGKINLAAGTADAGALDLWKDFNRTISDPGSVLYAHYMGQNENGGHSYNVEAQGTSVFDIIGHFVSVYRMPSGSANIYASYGGITKYMDDEETNLSLDHGAVGFNRSGDYRLWDESPIDANTDNYFGLAPTLEANGKYYQPFYAAFPFNFASDGMRAFYISKFDATFNVAVISEISGNVPGATPIIVECSSNAATDNRLNLLYNQDLPIQGNQLAGVYFCNKMRPNSNDAITPYNAETMRVLTTDAQGNLVFAKADLDNLPANQSYLPVPAGTADAVTIMTEEEYTKYVAGIHNIVADGENVSPVYSVSGAVVLSDSRSLSELPAGIYIVGGKKVVIY